ncbi:hypothetical protein BC939DRAFT_479994 [Gamsiella multidivaricata]|uniref:uncharacterized protein n=1 Tax=Gamsiella multidivaricata TaxID=101098 RepID=UPI00221FA40D|nr:uncharacterized protein BC939DRAFT_479994 [Gamsiella multidivaricata]KAI7818939.1 hypothetical protein BC939DRAFT_479994 [Gamsiella multidivaricata]
MPLSLETSVASSTMPRSPFMLPELDRLIASHLDQDALANASRVCRLWHSIFNPILWKQLSLKHIVDDDDYDEDFNFVSRVTPQSPLLSPPSSCSSTWSAMSMGSPASPTSPVSASFPRLSLLQQAFIHSSRNKVLKGLLRHGHLVHELKATGITDQEMAVIGILCTHLRVLEMIGGRYTAEDLTSLFKLRRDTIQVVRFRSCVQLRDIFQPMRQLSNLREFELYGSFVGNTITSPYFFDRDLFPMLQACPQLRSILIEQVYIVDQNVDQGGSGWDGGGGSNEIPHQNQASDMIMMTAATAQSSSSLALSLAQTSMLSAQLRSSPIGQPMRNNPRIYSTPTSSLKSLTLDCGDIPDSVINALLSRCPLLESLSLGWSRNLSDATLLLLHRFCPNLTEISLYRCDELSSDGYKALFRNYPNLSSIDLDGNVLSDSVLEELSRSCRFLRHLSINSCQNVTDLGIQAILLNCAYLSSFSLRFISGLSSALFDDTTGMPLLPSSKSSPPSPSSSSLSSSPSFVARLMSEPGPYRRWACQETLESLYLPDLTLFNNNLVDIWRRQREIPTNNDRVMLKDDQLIQSRLRELRKLRHLTIGGQGLDLRVALDGLKSPRDLEALRITKLKRTMTCDDAQWLVEQAAPNLKRLAIPVFGNRALMDWMEDRRPGLLSSDK